MLEVELAARVAERSSLFRITHRVRPVDGPVRVELRDRLRVLRRPRAFPCLGPPARCLSNVHRARVPWNFRPFFREPATAALLSLGGPGKAALWGSRTPITLATCGFGQAGRRSDRRESLGLKPE